MKTACIIPIKKNSERVPGKNFKMLCSKRLYEFIIEHAIEANCFDDIYVDTNSDEIKEYVKKKGLKVIDRIEILASNCANGNDLLVYHQEICPNYNYYFQLFATAPFLQPKTIKSCVETLLASETWDSCFTAIRHNGFFWLNDNPVNYRPEILPRSQDMVPIIEETTGLYGIESSALKRYKCRIGRKPYIHLVSEFEAVDINTEEDLSIADYIGRAYWKMGEG